MSEQKSYTGEDISEVMGIDFLPEQLAGIASEKVPGVIIASAGSGKTAVMAARVVFLVANEKVPAGQAVTQSFPLATKPLLQLAQILLGSTPTET